MKLGFFHGRDDAFYRERYAAKMWAFSGMPHERGVTTDVELAPGGAMPFGSGRSFLFETAQVPEGLVLLERHGSVLVSCDSLQNMTAPDEYFDEATARVMRPPELEPGVGIGPGFRNAGKPQPSDYRSLLELPFEHLLSAHGPPVLGDAHAQVAACVARELAR